MPSSVYKDGPQHVAAQPTRGGEGPRAWGKGNGRRPRALPARPVAFTCRTPLAVPRTPPHAGGAGAPVRGLRELLQTVQQTLEGAVPGSRLCLHCREEEHTFALSLVMTHSKKAANPDEQLKGFRARDLEMWAFLQLLQICTGRCLLGARFKNAHLHSSLKRPAVHGCQRKEAS